MKKMLFFDVETTGLDWRVNGIHQLAGEIVIDNEVVEAFDFRIKPFKGCEINERALEVSNTKRSDFSLYLTGEEAYFRFYEMLEKYVNCKDCKDKYFLAGWRAPEFDVKFLQAFFERTAPEGIFNSYFWNNPIDVKVLATQCLINERAVMDSFSLAPVAKHLGVEVDESKLHSAAYDAYLSRLVYEIVTR